MSEMFFLLCAWGDEPPGRVLESGRGGGQSTEVLGQAFPAASVISVEENDHSPNARAAVARLARLANVECRFGDSRRLLPEILRPGDLVLIDGPQGVPRAQARLPTAADRPAPGGLHPRPAR